MVNHSAKTFNGKDSDIWVFMKNEMSNFLHEGIWIIVSCFFSTCVVHHSLRVQNVEFDNKICNYF